MGMLGLNQLEYDWDGFNLVYKSTTGLEGAFFIHAFNSDTLEVKHVSGKFYIKEGLLHCVLKIQNCNHEFSKGNYISIDEIDESWEEDNINNEIVGHLRQILTRHLDAKFWNF